MNEKGHLQMLSMIKSFEFECRNLISAWALSNQFLIFGTISGSLLYYEKSDTSKSCIVAFEELMDTITTIRLMNNRTNDIIIGTKKGTLGLVQVKYAKQKIVDQSYQNLVSFDEDIVDVIVYHNQAWIICTSQRVFLIRYQTDLEGMIKIREKRVLFESQNSKMIQVTASENKVLVSTWKSYFAIDIQTNEIVQIGSKEKQGMYGATFLFDDTKELVIYAARPLGRVWKANSTSGKVLNTLQFFSEDGNKLNVGILKDFAARCIVSYNVDNLTVFDSHTNQILREEKFESEFLPLFQSLRDQSQEDFYLLFQEKEKKIIRRCSLRSIEEAFQESFESNDGDEAMKVFLKHGGLWLKKNIEKIFDNKTKIQNQNIFEDPKFTQIIEKIEEEERLRQGGDSKIIIGLEDFNNVKEYNFENKSKKEYDFNFENQNIEKMTLKMNSRFEKMDPLKFGKEITVKNQDKIKKATLKIRALKNRLRENLEFMSILKMTEVISREDFPRRILNSKKIQYNYSLSKKFLFYMREKSLFAEGSLFKIEQINVKYRKFIRLSFANQMMTQLLLKKHIYGFLNKTERLFLKELEEIKNLCL